MKTLVSLMMLAAALAVVPNVSADACSGDPSAEVEVCHSFGSVSGDVHSKRVILSGCLIDVDGTCVPRTATLVDGSTLAGVSATTVYVGVDVNACRYIALPPVVALSCSASYDTTATTSKVIGAL